MGAFGFLTASDPMMKFHRSLPLFPLPHRLLCASCIRAQTSLACARQRATERVNDLRTHRADHSYQVDINLKVALTAVHAPAR
jgi:hypothetical protein